MTREKWFRRADSATLDRPANRQTLMFDERMSGFKMLKIFRVFLVELTQLLLLKTNNS